MRVYHFLSEKYGIQAIAESHLKVGRLSAFNDPFEFFHLDTNNHSTREILRGRKKRANWDYGIICFSKDYSSPVQWAHYGDSHKGICLGFDIPDESLLEIEYVDKRATDSEFKNSLMYEKEQFLKFMLSKKHKHWEYEKEHRLLIKFPKRQMGNDLIFENFSDRMILKEVIIGFRSLVTKKALKKLLGNHYKNVNIQKVFPSHTEYKMGISD